MASKDKIFLDTDVVLDHFADRQPFAEYAHRLFALAQTGELTVCSRHFRSATSIEYEIYVLLGCATYSVLTYGRS